MYWEFDVTRKHYGDKDGRKGYVCILLREIGLLKNQDKSMFSWWSSLEPPKSEGGGDTSEKPVEREPKTTVENSDDSKPDVSTNESERKGSELDYAKDVAKNVGSKYF